MYLALLLMPALQHGSGYQAITCLAAGCRCTTGSSTPLERLSTIRNRAEPRKFRRLIKVSSACGGTSVREAGPEFGPQGDENGSELNPRGWQGDCIMGIDQKPSEMFTELEGGWATDSVHYPDDIAARRLPTTPRFAAAAS